jgi:putative FmdB family regulatory protein
MPAYPFSCKVCGHAEDFVHKMDERDAPHQCPKCGNMLQRKMATGMMVQWKGRWRDQWRNAEGFQDGLGIYGE